MCSFAFQLVFASELYLAQATLGGRWILLWTDYRCDNANVIFLTDGTLESCQTQTLADSTCNKIFHSEWFPGDGAKQCRCVKAGMACNEYSTPLDPGRIYQWQDWGCVTGSYTGCASCVEQSLRSSDTTCATCNSGYYETNGFCDPWGCVTGGDAGCTSCVGQSLRSSDTTCAACNSGYYESNGACQAWGCLTAAGAGCASCVGQALRSSDTTCAACNSGYYESNGACQAWGCLKAAGTGCADCVEQALRTSDTNCAACNSGYYESLGTCQAWGCTTSDGAGCATCVQQWLRRSTTTCATCNDGFYESGGACGLSTTAPTTPIPTTSIATIHTTITGTTLASGLVECSVTMDMTNVDDFLEDMDMEAMVQEAMSKLLDVIASWIQNIRSVHVRRLALQDFLGSVRAGSSRGLASDFDSFRGGSSHGLASFFDDIWIGTSRGLASALVPIRVGPSRSLASGYDGIRVGPSNLRGLASEFDMTTSGGVRIEFDVVIPPDGGPGAVTASLVMEKFEKKSMEEASDIVNKVLKSGALGTKNYTVEILVKKGKIKQERHTTEAPKPSDDEFPIMFLAIAVMGGSACLLITFLFVMCRLRKIRRKPAAIEERISFKMATDEKTSLGEAELLFPPDSISADAKQQVLKNLSDLTSESAPMVFVCFAGGGQDEDLDGRGVFYAAAVVQALTRHGISCYVSLPKAKSDTAEFVPCERFPVKLFVLVETREIYACRNCLNQIFSANANDITITRLQFEQWQGIPKKDDQWSNIPFDDIKALEKREVVRNTMLTARLAPDFPDYVQSVPGFLEAFALDLSRNFNCNLHESGMPDERISVLRSPEEDEDRISSKSGGESKKSKAFRRAETDGAMSKRRRETDTREGRTNDSDHARPKKEISELKRDMSNINIGKKSRSEPVSARARSERSESKDSRVRSERSDSSKKESRSRSDSKDPDSKESKGRMERSATARSYSEKDSRARSGRSLQRSASEKGSSEKDSRARSERSLQRSASEKASSEKDSPARSERKEKKEKK